MLNIKKYESEAEKLSWEEAAPPADYDPEFSEIEAKAESGDYFLEDSDFHDDTSSNAVPQDASCLREWLIHLRDSEKLTPADYQSYLTEVKRAVGLSNTGRNAAFEKITQEISAKFLDSPIGGSEKSEDSGTTEGIVAQAEQLKKTIEAMDNLRNSDKQKFLDRIEQELHRLDLAKDSPDAGESVRDEVSVHLEEVEIEATELGAYPAGVTALSEALSLDPSEVKLPSGLDLENPPNPPSKAFIEKLIELSPELKGLVDQVKTAVNERQASVETNLQSATNQNNANTGSTTDADHFDTLVWQGLYDLKYHQDPKSKAVVDAMNACSDKLASVLQAIYGDQLKVEKKAAASATGWQATDNAYQVAGVLRIGSSEIDLFDNQSGELFLGAPISNPPDFEIPGIAYDGAGDGVWDPGGLGVHSYGESLHKSSYDDNDDSWVSGNHGITHGFGLW